MEPGEFELAVSASLMRRTDHTKRWSAPRDLSFGLALQALPERIGVVVEHERGGRAQDRPTAEIDFMFELSGAPSGVADVESKHRRSISRGDRLLDQMLASRRPDDAKHARCAFPLLA
jgi:hypothetical protein